MTRDEVLPAFLDTLSFDLYEYQENALMAWFTETELGGVMVCAPTGMGKTLLAEAALYEALATGQQLYYTTPLIALSDQKFREFQDLAERWGFERDQIGLITGNRRVNADAPVRVVVAEILLNHLLASDPAIADFSAVSAVVMDEFHSFNDQERGIVWELSLVLLPTRVRVLLLSATVGNPIDFAQWIREKHQRRIRVITSDERRVPLEQHWVEDQLLTELLPKMSDGDEHTQRTPALVFCFSRDECWDVAEKLKGLPLISKQAKPAIEAYLDEHQDALSEGVGPKLQQMLIRGVGVHHAGVLPRHKYVVEELFLKRLVPFVVCTETLAAGINLPARSVVLGTLLKGKHGEKKLIPPSTAHQIMGRAGRPQFDTQGHVYAVAHDDDVKINKWKARYDQIDPNSKDPGVMRARKDMERKRPRRRNTEQYWSAGQFKQLIEAGPARLASRSMIPYNVLVFLLTKFGTLHSVHDFLDKRFATSEQIEKFHQQLDFMLGNLDGLGYLERSEDGDHITVNESMFTLLQFRSVDPLYGAWLCKRLTPANDVEKLIALESVLQMPPPVVRKTRLPDELPKGPLQEHELEPLMVQMGVMLARPATADDDDEDAWEEEEERPPTFPEMLKIDFEAGLPNPEPIYVQPKWVAGGAFEMKCEFFKFVRSRDLVKQEGIVLRHLLRLVILAGEFFTYTADPQYQEIAQQATQTCRRVDADYTDRFLSEAQQRAALDVEAKP